MAIPPLGHNPRAFPGSLVGNVTDEFGNIIISADNDGDITGDAFTSFIQYGFWNGDFALGPVEGTGVEIDQNNEARRMPYLTGPVQVSGQSVYVTWELDSTVPSGYVLRFHLPPGAAGDEAYMEQIGPVGGDFGRATGGIVRYVAQSSGGVTTLTGFVATQYLKADGTTTGASRESAVAGLIALPAYNFVATTAGVSPPADARYLRIRFGIRRGAALTSDSASIDFANIRQDIARPYVLLAEQAQPTLFAPGRVSQSAGTIQITPGDTGSPVLQIPSGGNVNVGGVDISLSGHGAADHANLARTIWLPADTAHLESGAFSATVLGTAPDQIIVVAMADAATTGAYWAVKLPSDFDSGNLTVKPYWAPGSTDASSHAVRWSYDLKCFVGGTDVTSAGTTTGVTGVSGARTANVLVTGEAATDTGVAGAIGGLVMVNVRRVGANAADTYVGTVNLVGVVLGYTANQ
jgi:hypothetical protein